MKNLFIFILLYILFSGTLFPQSKIQIEKQRSIYAKNNVKKEIITGSDENISVSKYDKKGNVIETVNFTGKIKNNITTYTYYTDGTLKKQSYFGYQSGDGFEVFYFYDETGNVEKTKTIGSDDNETYYKYDAEGNITESKFTEPGNTESYVTRYVNLYENGRLISCENECTTGTESVTLTKYFYEGDMLNKEESYEKNCKSGSLNLNSVYKLTYFENGLIKETSFDSYGSFTFVSNTYKYEFY
jgi:hypothetical protein